MKQKLFKSSFGFMLVVFFSAIFVACENNEEVGSRTQSSSFVSESEVKAFAKSLEVNMNLCEEGRIDLATFNRNLLTDSHRLSYGGTIPISYKVVSFSESFAVNNPFKDVAELEEYCSKHFSKAFCVLFSYMLYKHEIPLSIQEIVEETGFSEDEKFRLLLGKYLIFAMNTLDSQKTSSQKYSLPSLNDPKQQKREECWQAYEKQLDECKDDALFELGGEVTVIGSTVVGTIIATGGIGAVAAVPIIFGGVATGGVIWASYDRCTTKAERAYDACIDKIK